MLLTGLALAGLTVLIRGDSLLWWHRGPRVDNDVLTLAPLLPR